MHYKHRLSKYRIKYLHFQPCSIPIPSYYHMFFYLATRRLNSKKVRVGHGSSMLRVALRGPRAIGYAGPSTPCKLRMYWYGAETLRNKFYVRRETLHLFPVFCASPFWYTQQLYFQNILRRYISHGTDPIITRYDTGRTEIPFSPFDFCICVSHFLLQNSPIEGTPHQCPFRGILAEH
jgi:hypothetical protein